MRFNFDKKWDKNADNFTDLTLQKRLSLFNKWSFVRREGRSAEVAVRYLTENRWGGQMQWTPAWYASDSIYGENIKTQRIELIGNYQLPFKEKRKSVMADGSIVEHDVVGPIEVKFMNRSAVCNAVVLQGDNEPLLGAIPMEEMDVLIHPRRQELIVNPEHPYFAQLKMK